jgi:phosphatidylinositol kinase/protein kinase (PI-3  family)
MRTLRSHKESILVIVEAFRYDPLIGWKLTSKGDKGEMRLEHADPEAI